MTFIGQDIDDTLIIIKIHIINVIGISGSVYQLSLIIWLMMEFKRLVELEATGEKDEEVFYDASDLEEQIMHR